jgi:hypothetical protein
MFREIIAVQTTAEDKLRNKADEIDLGCEDMLRELTAEPILHNMADYKTSCKRKETDHVKRQVDRWGPTNLT